MKAELHKKSIIPLGLLLLCLGTSLIILGSFGVAYSRLNPLSFDIPATSSTSQGTDEPVHVNIPSLGISLPIVESTITNGIWEVSNKAANHLNSSALPDGKGNIVIYAHNLKVLFGSLPYIRKDAQITITGKSGKIFNFKVIQTIAVSPDAIEYVSPKNNEVLTLYTCTGFLDSKRFVVVAIPVE